MTNTAVDDFLFGSSCPSAKFPEIGTKVKGVILDAEVSQQTDPKTKMPKLFASGDPMMQIVITLQTDLRDPEIEDDDGRRRLYAKGGKGNDKGKSMRDAIADAVRKAGQTKLEVGADLAVKHTAEGERSSSAFDPPKLYRAEYTPPVKGVEFDDPEEPF